MLVFQLQICLEIIEFEQIVISACETCTLKYNTSSNPCSAKLNNLPANYSM